MWARLRVYERAGDVAAPAELLPRLYGGCYDRLTRRYLPGMLPGPGEAVHEVSCHKGQLSILLFEERAMRVLALGGPGSGKTRVLVMKLGLKGLDRPNSTWLFVGATADRKQILWDDFQDVWKPTGWVDEINETKGWIVLANGARFLFKAAKEPSKAMGTPLQGISADGAGIDETQNVHDRAQRDVDERGRRAGTRYTVFETATIVDGLGHFARRRKEYESNPHKRIIRLNPLDNPFVEPGYWERFRESYNERDWRQRIMSEDMPPEKLVAHAFSYEHNIRPRPRPGNDEFVDVTAELNRRYGTTKSDGSPARFRAGQDFGVLTNATIMLQAWRHKVTGKVSWWAIDEISSRSHTSSEAHGRKLAKGYSVDEVVVIADPHFNTTDTDKSDYEQFRRLGFNIHRASAKNIMVKHRWSMMNTLLCDSLGNRRFFIDCDEHRKPKCPQLVESFLTMETDEHGNLENVRKDYSDPTHWPAAAQFGMYPDEKFIATGINLVGPGGNMKDPLLVEAEKYR